MYKPPTDRNKEFTNHRGTTFTFTRSYNVHNYTHENQISRGITNAIMKTTGVLAFMAKAKCLQIADREPDMTIVAIEKDEDYTPDFKTCVSEKVNELLAARNSDIAAAKATALEKGQPEPTHLGFEFTLPEDKAEGAIDTAFDLIKLSELKDHDRNMYKAFK